MSEYRVTGREMRWLSLTMLWTGGAVVSGMKSISAGQPVVGWLLLASGFALAASHFSVAERIMARRRDITEEG